MRENYRFRPWSKTLLLRRPLRKKTSNCSQPIGMNQSGPFRRGKGTDSENTTTWLANAEHEKQGGNNAALGDTNSRGGDAKSGCWRERRFGCCRRGNSEGTREVVTALRQPHSWKRCGWWATHWNSSSELRRVVFSL